MYLIPTIAMMIGASLPSLWGASMFDVWPVVGSIIGGIVGVVIYAKLRASGLIE